MKEVNSLVLFRDYKEDARGSMEIYADNLERALKKVATSEFEIKSFVPSIPNWLSKSCLSHAIKIRLSRYFLYPLQAKKHQGTISHIIDQSYGHLLNSLNSSCTVITVHDLIPLLAWNGLIPGLSYPHYPLLFKITVAALRKAGAIIAVSENTKRDLVTYCGLSANKITVIYNGIDSIFKPERHDVKAQLRSKLGLPNDDSYLILITGNQSYKNHLTSFRVVERLQSEIKKPIFLIWLGANKLLCNEYAKEVSPGVKVIQVGCIDKMKVVELYNSVDCLLFPSWYEGFGWPPLEAMACGTPVVSSNSASLPEIVGNAALTYPADDIDGLAYGVKLMLTDDSKRLEYISRGYDNVSRFTWERCASEVLDLYMQLKR